MSYLLLGLRYLVDILQHRFRMYLRYRGSSCFYQMCLQGLEILHDSLEGRCCMYLSRQLCTVLLALTRLESSDHPVLERVLSVQ